MLRTLHDLGYSLEWRVINAADYGAAQRRRRIFIFGWKNTSKYGKSTHKQDIKKYVYETGLFAKQFPIEKHSSEDENHEVNIIDYVDTVDMTNRFKASFETAGAMICGNVYTSKITPIPETPITMGEIREKRNNLQDYILDNEKADKFGYLRGAKKILRKKPNGDPYYYTEGAMSPYDKLDMPARTMLTSEGSVNRSTHIIPDKETGKLRLITPIEAERLQGFPDNWTNTGMPERRRYFMMGNALVTNVINRLEPQLKSIIENE